MKKEEIHALDWHRILLGNAPLEFLVEVLVRTLIIYLILLVVLRFMGKRMGGQLSISELAVMLTLGAIVSVAMQAPDRGLLLGAVVLLTALAFQRGHTYLTVKNKKFEEIAQGHVSVLIKNGVLCHNELLAMKISREQIFSVIRTKKLHHLGEVERMYLEACGLFSVLRYREPRPGLSVLPTNDQGASQTLNVYKNIEVCKNCGFDSRDQFSQSACKNCGNTSWTNAVLTKEL